MMRNAFKLLAGLLPDAPVLVGRVLAHHDDDTSTVELPINLAVTAVGGGVARGSLIRPRGRTVPVGGWAFVRRGVIETRAPDPAPEAISVGAPVAPPAPSGTPLFWARFNATSNRDEVGNWAYVLDEYIDPGDTYVIDNTTGAPGSGAGSMNKADGGRRFYIQHVDNEAGGTGTLGNAEDFNGFASWTYSVWFRVPTSDATNINLGGFNAGGADGQTVFSLNYYHDAEFPSIEARIGHSAGQFYLYADVVASTSWRRVRIRNAGSLWELLLDDAVIDSRTQAVAFANIPLINFAIDKHYSGTRTGWFDEPILTFIPA
jgi:hypothetical protein